MIAADDAEGKLRRSAGHANAKTTGFTSPPNDTSAKRRGLEFEKMAISFRHYNRVAMVSAGRSGDFEWSGDTTTANFATAIMYANGWTRGTFLSDELFVVRRVVKVLGDCEALDADLAVNSLRDGWTQLLRDHLMPDPGAPELGQHLFNLTTGRGVACDIEARGSKLSLAYGHARTRRWPVSGVVSVADPTFLRFPSRIGNTAPRVRFPVRKAMWERIVSIHFLHFSPTPESVMEGRAKVRERLSERTPESKQTLNQID